MQHFFGHLLFPGESNNFRAKALHFEFFAGYVFLLLAPFVIFATLLFTKPGILGTTAFFDPGQIIAKTNSVREKVGIFQLAPNPKLTAAAQAKAEDMVSGGYWAHFAPNGKSPWDFVRESGYNFTAAGENLARDFENIDQMTSAWLASPSHADNLLSSNFTEIGIGVATGVISGKSTTVVVQMFGKPAFIPVAQARRKPAKLQTTLEGRPVDQLQVGAAGGQTKYQSPQGRQVLLEQAKIIDVSKLATPTVFNVFTPAKITTLALISFISLLIFADFAFVKFAKLARLGPHPMFHLVIFVIVLFAIWYSNSGLIL